MHISSRDVAGHRALKRTDRGTQLPPLYRFVSIFTLVAMLFGGFALMQPQEASAQTSATTTDALNLRSGPATSYPILSVIPSGSSLSIVGSAENGFYPVDYRGWLGYAHGDWISTSGSTPPSNSGTGTATVIDGALNLRSGASTGHRILAVMPGGATVTLTGQSSNGFLSVSYSGTAGWAFAEYLSTSGAPAPAPTTPPVGTSPIGTMTTTARLNMRSGPSTNSGIVMVMPSGAAVEIMGDAQSGFYPVRYGGSTGFASGEYLSSGSTAPTPTPPPASTPTGSMTTTAALNMRSGPGTSYGVITVIPYATSVEIMGAAQSGFYPVRYGGNTGFASADFLTTGTVTPPTTPPASGDEDIIAIIYAAADRYGQPRADMLRVARCESVLDPSAVNPYSNASGLFQFLPSTWATTPYANQDIFDPVANANAAAWMWSVGRRNEWVCQ